MAPPDPISAACVVAVSGSGKVPKLLWVRLADDAPALGGFHVCPGARVDPRHSSDPSDGGAHLAARVAALRGLFATVGLLHAHGSERLSDDEVAELRDLLQEDRDEGTARFPAQLAAKGLSWRTAELEPIGRWITPDHVAARHDTRFFALHHTQEPLLDASVLEVEEAAFVEAPAALSRWARAEVMLAPPLVSLLRSMSERGEVAPEALRATYGAGGEPSLRWEIVPFVQVLPLRTPTLPPATHTNAYLVGSGQAVLVEPATPYPDELDRAVRWVEEARVAGIAPIALLATHHHPDHVGGARALAERLALPLWGHRLTAELLQGILTFDRFVEDEEEIVLEGPTPVRLRALHTPGHAPGHLCFVEPVSGAMIVGDMVASVGTILIEPTDGDMQLYLDSLRRMADRAPTLLLPAHGLPIRDPATMLQRYIAHRLSREAKVLAALTSLGRPASPGDLLPLAYDDAPRAVWPLAVLSTEAHLIKLERDGRARRTDAGWISL